MTQSPRRSCHACNAGRTNLHAIALTHMQSYVFVCRRFCAGTQGAGMAQDSVRHRMTLIHRWPCSHCTVCTPAQWSTRQPLVVHAGAWGARKQAGNIQCYSVAGIANAVLPIVDRLLSKCGIKASSNRCLSHSRSSPTSCTGTMAHVCQSGTQVALYTMNFNLLSRWATFGGLGFQREAVGGCQ